MLLMLMLMPFFCLSSFFEAFGVHSRRKRNAGNRAKFFGEGSGRGKKGVLWAGNVAFTKRWEEF